MATPPFAIAETTPQSADVVLNFPAAERTFRDIVESWLTLLSDPATGTARAGVPVGGEMDFAGTVAPAGWLLEYGQSVLRADYAALFAVIGTTYGAVDGTHFTIPDKRGRTTAGKDDMGGVSANRLTTPINGDTLGAAGGAESVALITANVAAHTHTFSDTATTSTGSVNHSHAVNSATAASGAGGDAAVEGVDNGGSIPTTASGSAHTHTVTVSGTTSSTGSGTAHANVQPTFISNKIIYAGV